MITRSQRLGILSVNSILKLAAIHPSFVRPLLLREQLPWTCQLAHCCCASSHPPTCSQLPKAPTGPIATVAGDPSESAHRPIESPLHVQPLRAPGGVEPMSFYPGIHFDRSKHLRGRTQVRNLPSKVSAPVPRVPFSRAPVPHACSAGARSNPSHRDHMPALPARRLLGAAPPSAPRRRRIGADGGAAQRSCCSVT